MRKYGMLLLKAFFYVFICEKHFFFKYFSIHTKQLDKIEVRNHTFLVQILNRLKNIKLCLALLELPHRATCV